jgi:hypothetical protein
MTVTVISNTITLGWFDASGEVTEVTASESQAWEIWRDAGSPQIISKHNIKHTVTHEEWK